MLKKTLFCLVSLSKHLLLGFTLLLLYLSMPYAHAGMPGSFQLVFLDISQPPYQDGQTLMKQLRHLEGDSPGEDFFNVKPVDESYREGSCFSCRGGMDDYHRIGILYLYTVPVGLTVEDARKAVAGDMAARNKIQQILQDFQDHDGATLHGMVLYDHTQGMVTLYAIQAVVGTPITSVNKAVKNRLRLSSLDALMYQISKKIPRPV